MWKTPMFEKLFVLVQYLLPHHFLSRLAGSIAECRWPWFKNRLIRWFIHRYQVDMSEAADPGPDNYPHFNAFFTRALHSTARPIDTNQHAIISPADGCISQIGAIDKGSVLQAKGQNYSLLSLLANDQQLADDFHCGHFATIYLAPRDYHRAHMPIAGKLRDMYYVPGTLFSVNHATATYVPGLFARNERVVCVFDTAIGPMIMVLIGAMLVASIETVWAGTVTPQQRVIHHYDYRPRRAAIHLSRGAEMGRFKLGSTVILLFAEGAVQWQQRYVVGSRLSIGEALAEPVKHFSQKNA